MRKKTPLFYLIFWFTITLAQPTSPFIQKFTNKEYGKKSNPETYCIQQDQQNNIIAGTSNGVLIYNGHQWNFIGVKEGYVTALAKTASGKILIRQCDKGLFELQNNHLVLVDSSDQMKTNGVFAIFENQGKLHYFFRNENSTIPYEKSIYGGIRLKDGKFLIYTLCKQNN